ncbi:hypothetical protein Tco_0204822, partial [Tanacetum coccineum]
FRSTVTDATANAHFTFFSPAGSVIIGHPYVEVAQKYRGAPQSALPIEITDIIGKKTPFLDSLHPRHTNGIGSLSSHTIKVRQKPKTKLAMVSKITKGKPDAFARCQSNIAAANVPVSAKRKYFNVGSTSQGKKQKHKFSEVDVPANKSQEPVASPCHSSRAIELVANGVKIKSSKKLDRMIREILHKQRHFVTRNQNATSPSLASKVGLFV